MSEKEPKLEAVVNEQQQEKTKKEVEREKRYWNKTITRQEAFDLARGMVRDMMAQPIRELQDVSQANSYHLYAVADLLIDKGIIESREDLQPYVDKLIKEVEQSKEGEADAQQKEEG